MPSNRKFLTTYDGAGRPNSVGTSAGSYVSSVTYAPQGAPSQVVFGNGVTETRNYNARLQPMQIAAGTSSTSFLNLQYGYSPAEQRQCDEPDDYAAGGELDTDVRIRSRESAHLGERVRDG